MSRYIDADELRKETEKKIREANSYRMAVVDGEFLDLIDDAPTEDVVEVVRCRDCKHNVANWQHDELDIGDYTDIVCDYFMTDGMEANDYCSHGERSENGT